MGDLGDSLDTFLSEARFAVRLASGLVPREELRELHRIIGDAGKLLVPFGMKDEDWEAEGAAQPVQIPAEWSAWCNAPPRTPAADEERAHAAPEPGRQPDRHGVRLEPPDDRRRRDGKWLHLVRG